MVKNLPAMQETQVWSVGQKDPLEKEMTTPSSSLVWKIPWDRGAWWATSAGMQRVRQDWATNTFTFIYILNNKVCQEKDTSLELMIIFTMITKLYIIYAYVDVIYIYACVCVSLLLKNILATPRGMWDLSSPPMFEPAPPALEAWSQNHWAVREFPISLLFFL